MTGWLWHAWKVSAKLGSDTVTDAKGEIKSPDEEIKWQHIKDLNSKQDEIRLRLRNMLTARHIDFYYKKIKCNWQYKHYLHQ